MPTDAQLVAAKQKYEVYYIAHRYNLKPSYIRQIAKQQGRSRRKIYAYLERCGYLVINKN